MQRFSSRLHTHCQYCLQACLRFYIEVSHMDVHVPVCQVKLKTHFHDKKSYFFLKSFWVLAITNFSLTINQLGNNLGKEGKANNTVNFVPTIFVVLSAASFVPCYPVVFPPLVSVSLFWNMQTNQNRGMGPMICNKTS